MSGRGPCIIKGMEGEDGAKRAPPLPRLLFQTPVRLAYEKSVFVIGPWVGLAERHGSRRVVEVRLYHYMGVVLEVAISYHAPFVLDGFSSL